MKRIIFILLTLLSQHVYAQDFNQRLQEFRSDLIKLDSANTIQVINYKKDGTDKGIVIVLVWHPDDDASHLGSTQFSLAVKTLNQVIVKEKHINDVNVKFRVGKKIIADCTFFIENGIVSSTGQCKPYTPRSEWQTTAKH